MSLYLAFLAAFIWLISFLLPWQPWRTREELSAEPHHSQADLSDVTVIIPARDEAQVIGTTLAALENQGWGLTVIVVNDESSDDTAKIVQQSTLSGLSLINSEKLPEGWTGKLWAQHQGIEKVNTPLTLLLDADIKLSEGMIGTLKHKLQTEQLHFVSLMAKLRFSSFWEKLLMPAFIYFFKMIYPFALANHPKSKVAAAAGGCILVETAVLKQIGAMEVLKDAVIDDCTLAKTVKQEGCKTWIGLTHGVSSQRPCVELSEIWNMVARTAYTQLRYSVTLLLLCTFLMLLMYCLPVLGIFYFQGTAWILSLSSLAMMIIMYRPTLRFYSLNSAWSFAMPVIAGLYLLMTWSSAIRYWKGVRSEWKGRIYKTD
ncbi:MAG: glycosyltransferase [Methylococcaceae bacterium]|nr:glycosyltransferase [Methylococcaceae bacterium]